MDITGGVHVESGVIQCRICIRKLCLDAALYDDLFFFEFFFYQKLCKYAVNIFGKGFTQIRNALLQFFIFLKTALLYLYRMLPISKVMPGTVWLGFRLIIKKKFSSQMNPND